jgi:hypothetical protein
MVTGVAVSVVSAVLVLRGGLLSLMVQQVEGALAIVFLVVFFAFIARVRGAMAMVMLGGSVLMMLVGRVNNANTGK